MSSPALHRKPDGSIVRAGHDAFGPGNDYSPPRGLFALLKRGAGDREPTYRASLAIRVLTGPRNNP